MLIGCIEFSYAGEEGKGTPGEEKALAKAWREGFPCVEGWEGEQTSITRSSSRYGNYRNQNLRMPMAFGSSHLKYMISREKKKKASTERA